MMNNVYKPRWLKQVLAITIAFFIGLCGSWFYKKGESLHFCENKQINLIKQPEIDNEPVKGQTQIEEIKTADEDNSPHQQALTLVLNTQKSIIEKVEMENEIGLGWWFDTKDRSWSVRRLFAPGYIDSTHMLSVEYSIDHKLVARWAVDLYKMQVSKPYIAKTVKNPSSTK